MFMRSFFIHALWNLLFSAVLQQYCIDAYSGFCRGIHNENNKIRDTKYFIKNNKNKAHDMMYLSISNFDYETQDKLPWLQSGYKSWSWNGNRINYVDLGGSTAVKKPPLLLIHGFGASVYHWRYNIPYLARNYHVYAIDLLGFGLSEKPIVRYSAEVWRDQVLDFIDQVILPDSQSERPGCVVAGNSLGGFTALYAAASARAASKERQLINGCILLNAAGRFRSADAVEVKPDELEWKKAITKAFQKFVIGLSFIYTKQPARIAQVLRQVYPVDASNVDDDLVQSIEYPARDPNAPEVFYRVISENGDGPPVFVDDLLSTLSVPLMLLWGIKDPWIRPQAAERIQALFPSAIRVDVDAGHCPHDESPDAVNAAISSFMSLIHKSN